MRSRIARNAVVIVAVILTTYALYWLRAILTPLALAVFVVVMIDGLARLLAHRVPLIPAWAALPVALVLSTVAFGLTVWAVASNAASFVGQLISDTSRLNALIAGVAGAFGVKVPPTVAQLIDQLNPSRYIGEVALALQSFGAGAFSVLIYSGFLIASRQGFQKKAMALFPDATRRERAASVFFRIRDSLVGYLAIQTLTGLLIAAGSWVVMAALGLDNALFWAFLIFVLTFIPVIGGAIGTVLPPLFALVQFPVYWRALAMFGALWVIGFVVGNVLAPRMQRDRLNIDPVVVLLSLAVWGVVWGVPGMFLSTPLTVAIITILAQFGGSRWIAILLSGDGEPEGRQAPVRRTPDPPSAARPALAAPARPADGAAPSLRA